MSNIAVQKEEDGSQDPPNRPELLARMRAALRRVNAKQDDVFAVDDLRVDLVRRKVLLAKLRRD